MFKGKPQSSRVSRRGIPGSKELREAVAFRSPLHQAVTVSASESSRGGVPWVRSLRAERILVSVMMRLRPPILNAVLLWNTRYLDAALPGLRDRYCFTAGAAGTELRPLRSPDEDLET